MVSRSRAFLAPVYLFVCLLLGGSAQGIWQNLLLQLGGVVIIAWAALDSVNEPLAPAARQLLWLGIALIAVVLLQLTPLPFGLWSQLGPRHMVAQGLELLGQRPKTEPLSVTPAASLSSLLAFIPPLALYCAMVRLKAYRSRLLALALVAGAIAGIALGTLQVAGSNPEISPWYIYSDTNFGKAVGFFANADHMASLLVITIPFIASMVAAANHSSVQNYSAVVALAVAAAIVVLVGLALNGSLAGYGLALPVIAASALIVMRRRTPLRLWIVGLAGLLVIASVAALETSPIGGGRIGTHATSAVQSRSAIVRTTMRAIGDFLPFGSGLGSFQSVYPLYEKPDEVTPVYVVHAHNDYAEVALELGAPGIVLICLFLVWWASAAWRVWRTAEPRPFARAASIASTAVLIHSLVDFPLRTAAIAASFAMCLALLADRRSASSKNEQRELRPARHRVI